MKWFNELSSLFVIQKFLIRIELYHIELNLEKWKYFLIYPVLKYNTLKTEMSNWKITEKGELVLCVLETMQIYSNFN